MSDVEINSSFDRGDFLNNYWQKKPLIIPAMLPQFNDLISAEELAGLACEEQVESRIIHTQGEGDRQSWKLRQGPFDDEDFLALPDKNWTLLVQAVDQWDVNIAQLKQLFGFIPSWRIDDVMISYATDGAGVGPHFDQYDVFLVQGSGSRRWQIGERYLDNSALRTGSDLRLVKDFSPTQEVILNCGDVLYLPPQFAHHGVSIGNSQCYSIGFRSPSNGEMLQGYGDFLVDTQSEHSRYTDAHAIPAQNPGELSQHHISEMFEQLMQISHDEALFTKWFGSNATQPKYPELIFPPEQLIDRQILQKPDQILTANPRSRFAYHVSADAVDFFVDGECYALSTQLLSLVKSLCASAPIQANMLSINLELEILLLELLNRGSLMLDKVDDEP